LVQVASAANELAAQHLNGWLFTIAVCKVLSDLYRSAMGY